MIHLSNVHLHSIREHAASAYPLECVGVILGSFDADKRVVLEVRPLDNRFDPSFEASVRPGGEEFGQERRYLISPETMLQLMREERGAAKRIIGFYHSHPDHPALPSETDREWAAPWYIYMIQSVIKGVPEDLTAWQLSEDGSIFNSVTQQYGAE